MRIQITERHCTVPAEVRGRTEAQMASLAKYDPRATSVDVVFEEERVTRKIEVIIHIDGGSPVIATGAGAEFREALDEVVERAARMLRKQRTRQRDHQAPPLAERITED